MSEQTTSSLNESNPRQALDLTITQAAMLAQQNVA